VQGKTALLPFNDLAATKMDSSFRWNDEVWLARCEVPER
jgi:hypothetical protein